MSKLYATLENSKGKIVSLSDNNEIVATVYEGNKKQYSVIIEWTDMGDIIDNEGNELPEAQKTKGSIITVREWRNTEQGKKKKDEMKDCSNCGDTFSMSKLHAMSNGMKLCQDCYDGIS